MLSENVKRGGALKAIDWLLALILVCCPVFQNYVSIYVNAGWVLLIIGFILFGMRILLCRKVKVCMKREVIIALSLLVLYYAYHAIDHGFTFGQACRTALVLFFFFCVATEQINFEYFLKIATAIILINCVCLLIQCIGYYHFGYHIQFVDITRVIGNERWLKRLGATTLKMVFYRPSGLFLEPSHVFLFSFPLGLYYLMKETASTKEKMIGFVILVELFLSTSGMGLAFLLALLFARAAMYEWPKYEKGSLRNLFTLRAAVILIAEFAIVAFLYLNVDLIHMVIERVISTTDSGYNAFEGRMSAGAELLEGRSTIQKIIGVTDAMGDLARGVSGYQSELYKYGVIGLIISYAFYLFSLMFTRKTYAFYLGVIMIGLSFFCAHSHREMYMLFVSPFIFDGLRGDAPCMEYELSGEGLAALKRDAEAAAAEGRRLQIFNFNKNGDSQ